MNSEIDKTKKYTFIDAWKKAINDSNMIITSEKSSISYKVDKLSKKLKFYNPIIASWQVCTYMLPEEIFNLWYITANINLGGW